MPTLMMLSFLEQYSKAINLDNEHFDPFFPQGRQRSDFLLFNETTICEFKDLCEFDVKKRVEHVARKKITTENDLKRDIYSTIEKKLSTANKQIRETKNALNKPDAIGLIIIENHIINDISGLSLMDAAERKMTNGLDSTDGVLCLDFVNTIISPEGTPTYLTQLVLPTTESSDETRNFYEFVEILMEDFCKAKNTPIKKGHDTSDLEQEWSLDHNGQYKKYTGKVDISMNKVVKP